LTCLIFSFLANHISPAAFWNGNKQQCISLLDFTTTLNGLSRLSFSELLPCLDVSDGVITS